MRGLHKSDVGCICPCARAHLLRTMVPPRPLVHRRSRRHTGIYSCMYHVCTYPGIGDPVLPPPPAGWWTSTAVVLRTLWAGCSRCGCTLCPGTGRGRWTTSWCARTNCACTRHRWGLGCEVGRCPADGMSDSLFTENCQGLLFFVINKLPTYHWPVLKWK